MPTFAIPKNPKKRNNTSPHITTIQVSPQNTTIKGLLPNLRCYRINVLSYQITVGSATNRSSTIKRFIHMKDSAIKLAMNAVDLLRDAYKESGYTSIARAKVEEYVTNKAKFLGVSDEDVVTILNHIDVIIQCRW